MEKLVEEVKKSRKKIGKTVKERLKEFRRNRDWFSELCFCILTANYTAEGGIRIQKEAGDFSNLSEKQIEALLRKMGHRFPNARAAYIELAKNHRDKLCRLPGMKDSQERREWLVKNVKGLGYKEASHFLRNIGYFDVAVIDRHILNVLADYNVTKQPKNLSKKRYLEIEKVLKKIAKKTSTELGELDLYLWHMKTGKVLK